MHAATQTAQPSLARRVAGQGAMLLASFGLGQGLSLARNALLSHWLSKGEFGVAATTLLARQLVEVLSDVGIDRHIVQSSDGDDERMQAAAHTMLVARGVLTSLVLFACAHPIAGFFHIPEAAWALQFAALAPLVRGFCHLDNRRFQRRYDNRAFVVMEVVPQAAALALMPAALTLLGGYAAVVVVLAVQAVIAWGLSLAVAERTYRLNLDFAAMRRMLAFGWPIWLAAFPTVAIFLGERIIVGHMFGVEALAAFTVAFMATMVPGQTATRVGHGLMLPLLSAVRSQPRRFLSHFRLMSEATTLVAAVYAALFLIAGESLLALAFGPAYRGLGMLAACLAVMWALRMMHAATNIALVSLGITRPLLTAACLRALALPVALGLALVGASLPAVAAVGAVGELAALLYVSMAAEIACAGLGGIVLRRSLFLVPACLAAGCLALAMPADADVMTALAVTAGLGSVLVMAAFAVMPGLRRFVDLRRIRQTRRRRLAAA